ncbi:MAG: AAA family ATPase [Saprospirales bacterium]|nr:AAA family ATPase [Saprospirales bacterium]
MTLRALHLENYKQYSRLDLEFRDGLVGIIGRNGAGKSTLFEAVLYCLYGKDERNKNLIRTTFADLRSTVVLELRFAVGPSEYLVKREFRGKTMAVNAELYKNDSLIAKGAAPVNDEVARILNMERDAFKRSVFSGQTELTELSKAKGEERKRMVRKMLGLDTLDDVQLQMNADARDLNSQIAGQRQNLLNAENFQILQAEITGQIKQLEVLGKALSKEQKKLRAVETAHKAAQQAFDGAEEQRKNHQALQQESGRLHERLDGLQAQRQTLTLKIGDLEAQQQKLAAQKPEFAAYERDQSLLRQLEEARQKYLNRAAYRTQLAEMEPALDQARQRIAGLHAILQTKDTTAAAIQELQTLIETLEKAIEQQREAFNQLKSRQEALGVRVDERLNKIRDLQKIGKEGTCPTCFQPVLEAYEQVLAQLNREIEALQGSEIAGLEAQKESVRQEGVQLRSRQDEARRELENRQTERARLQELAKQKSHEESMLKNQEAQVTRIQVVLREIGEVRFDEQQYTTLKHSVAAAAPIYQQFTNDTAYLVREMPASQVALQNTIAAIAETEKRMQECHSLLANTGFDQQRYDAARQALTQFGDAYAAQSDQIRALENRPSNCRTASPNAAKNCAPTNKSARKSAPNWPMWKPCGNWANCCSSSKRKFSKKSAPVSPRKPANSSSALPKANTSASRSMKTSTFLSPTAASSTPSSGFQAARSTWPTSACASPSPRRSCTSAARGKGWNSWPSMKYSAARMKNAATK